MKRSNPVKLTIQKIEEPEISFEKPKKEKRVKGAFDSSSDSELVDDKPLNLKAELDDLKSEVSSLNLSSAHNEPAPIDLLPTTQLCDDANFYLDLESPRSLQPTPLKDVIEIPDDSDPPPTTLPPLIRQARDVITHSEARLSGPNTWYNDSIINFVSGHLCQGDVTVLTTLIWPLLESNKKAKILKK